MGFAAIYPSYGPTIDPRDIENGMKPAPGLA